MTNREKLFQRMEKMSPQRLAAFLDDTASEEINGLVCRQCLKANKGECVMELRNLKKCPRKIADWLQEEAS